MKNFILTLAALGTLSGAALANPQNKPAPAPKTTKTAKKAGLICPVTGEKIASVKAAVGHSAYKGKTYYFCCPACKPKFDKTPAKYVANAAKGKYEKM